MFRLHALRATTISVILLGACAGAPPVVPPPDWAPNLPVASVLHYLRADIGCSAVAITPRLALTAAHCMPEPDEGADPDFGRLYGEDRPTARPVVRAEWFDVDMADIAVLEVAEPFAEWAHISPELPALGERLAIVGFCPKASARVRGAVAGGITAGYIYYVGELCPGDSGGGLFSQESGDLYGINVRIPAPGTGSATVVGYAAPLLYRFD